MTRSPPTRSRGHGAPRDVGVPLLVDVVEDQVELPLRLVEPRQRVADEDRHALGDARLREVPARLGGVLLRAVRVEDVPVGSDGAREPDRRVADGAPELEDAPRPDEPRVLSEEPTHRRPDDRDPAARGVRLHSREDRVPRREDREEVVVETGEEERHGGECSRPHSRRWTPRWSGLPTALDFSVRVLGRLRETAHESRRSRRRARDDHRRGRRPRHRRAGGGLQEDGDSSSRGGKGAGPDRLHAASGSSTPRGSARSSGPSRRPGTKGGRRSCSASGRAFGKLLELTALGSVFEMHTDRESAVASF